MLIDESAKLSEKVKLNVNAFADLRRAALDTNFGDFQTSVVMTSLDPQPLREDDSGRTVIPVDKPSKLPALEILSKWIKLNIKDKITKDCLLLLISNFNQLPRSVEIFTYNFGRTTLKRMATGSHLMSFESCLSVPYMRCHSNSHLLSFPRTNSLLP